MRSKQGKEGYQVEKVDKKIQFVKVVLSFVFSSFLQLVKLDFSVAQSLPRVSQ